MRLSDEERMELRDSTVLNGLRADSARLRASHSNDFIADGVVDCDRVIDFLMEYKEFFAAAPRARRLFIERTMKL